jgi:hypothetical protein
LFDVGVAVGALVLSHGIRHRLAAASTPAAVRDHRGLGCTARGLRRVWPVPVFGLQLRHRARDHRLVVSMQVVWVAGADRRLVHGSRLLRPRRDASNRGPVLLAVGAVVSSVTRVRRRVV